LNFLYKSWKILENIWEVSRASPGQNSEATFFNNNHRKIGTLKSDIENQILNLVEIALNTVA